MLNPHLFDEMKELAKFCLVMNIPYHIAKDMTELERLAFIEAYEEIHKKGR